MVSVHRYHEISESSHRIMNPLSLEKLLLVADICHIGSASRMLDLASGKGEMLCQLASKFGSTGIGVASYPPVVADARARAQEVGVAGTVDFIEGDAAEAGGFGRTFRCRKLHRRHVDWQRARRHIGVDEALGQTGRLDPRR